MKIRSKLTLLVGTVLVGAVLVFTLLVLSMAPLLRIQDEEKAIAELRDAQADLSIRLLRFPLETFDISREKLDEAFERSDAAFHSIEQMTYLPRLSPQIGEAVESIARLKDLQSERISRVLAVIEEIDTEVEEAVGFAMSYRLGNLNRNAMVLRSGKEDLFDLLVEEYEDTSWALLSGLEATIGTLEEQSARIESETRRVFLNGLLKAGIVALIAVTVSLILSLLMARRIASDVRAINRDMIALEKGDLTVRSALTSRDEIGELSQSLSRFTVSLAEYGPADRLSGGREPSDPGGALRRCGTGLLSFGADALQRRVHRRPDWHS